MTEPTEPDRSVADAILALRHDILSAGRDVIWGELRRRIKRLLAVGQPPPQPSPNERIQLLELYDSLARVVERRFWSDEDALRRFGYQRASDTLMFMFAEARDAGGVFDPGMAEAWIARERFSGRLRVDDYVVAIIDWMLAESEAKDRKRPGLEEAPAPFVFPPGLSRRPASPPSPPSR
ncbi:MAG TPA: hypothetical protein VKQ54_10375 [Caulobacteraceae bacterium]|nr:hypothetical protein [Caulobacteraceae bacterium]